MLTAENGEIALEVLEKHGRPDLLISDVVMPQMDGPTMVRHAREKFPDLPILFITGYAENAAIRADFLSQNMDMITKPFSLERLAVKVQEMMAGPSA